MSRRFIAAASQELEEHVYISIAQIMFKAMENSDIVAIILIACMWSAFMQSFSGILVEFDEYMRTFCAVLELKTSNLDTVHSFMTNLPAKMLPTVFDIALLVRLSFVDAIIVFHLTGLYLQDLRGCASHGRLGG
jgi:hypothetical protein